MDDKKVKAKLSEGYLYVRAIIEIAGKPKEYVEETLKTHLNNMKSDKNYIVLKETFESAEKLENYFDAFAEIEFLAKDPVALVAFCFSYMPGNVEILEPEMIEMPSNEFSGLLNDLQARSHALNTGVLELKEKNLHYVKNTAVLLRNFIVVLISSKPMTLKQMDAYMGVKEEDLLKVLDVLMKEKKIKKQGDIYSAIPKND